MKMLYFFESIRNPILDNFMYAVTQLGYETVFLVIALWLFWCVNKRKGYYMLAVGFWGLEINQLLKMIFRIPRPWILDPNFTIVEMARESAGGYSFPSGHTQIATGAFGAIAKTGKRNIRILCVILILLVATSRMYLGAHTPLDVSVSLLIGTALVIALYPFFFAAEKTADKRMVWLFAAMLIFALGVTIYIFTIDTSMVDAYNLNDAVKATSTVMGSLVALIIGYYAEKKYLNFETKAPLKMQLMKFLCGLILVLAIKEGAKKLLLLTPLPIAICDMIRYGMIVLIVILGWPAIFMKFTAKDAR